MTLPPADCVRCFRGVKKADKLFGESVDISVFAPDKEQPVLNGWLGASINWDLADRGALHELLNRQNKDKEIHFKGGAVMLPRKEMDIISKRFGSTNFTYEMREEGGNKYHGHLLFADSLIKERRTAIYGALCYIGLAVSNNHGQEQ